VAAEHADAAVAVAPPDVLHVGVEDAVAEGADELRRSHALVAEVRGVVVEAETLVALDRRDRALRRGDVERDLGRVHLEGEVHVELVVGLEDRAEALGEVGEAALVPILLRGRREGVERVPDRGAGEAVDRGRKSPWPPTCRASR
jgi:hypothetical protein